MAATTGRGNSSRRRRPALTASPIAKICAASALVACTMACRLPPAKKVFFALATTTPVTLCSSAACSAYSRSTAAFIESR